MADEYDKRDIAAVGVGGAWLRLACCLTLICSICLACAASPALGLSQRGHAYAFSFGEPGAGDGQFKDPASLAVDEATGDVYVSDSHNDRIERFIPERDGEGAIVGYRFASAWGWGVADGKKRYEVCTGACLPGIKDREDFDDPGQIAVDNSPGSRHDVYVVANHLGNEKGRVYELGPEGEPVSTTEQHGPEGAPAGQPLPAGQPPMALGAIEEEVKPGKWKRNEEGAAGLASELEVIEGVAVDATGLVWVYGEEGGIDGSGGFKAFTPQGALREEEPGLPIPEGLGVERAPGRSGIAVATLALGDKGSVTQDRLYARYEAEGETTAGKEPKRGFCSADPCLAAEIDAFNIAEDSEEHIAEESEEQVIDAALTGESSDGVAADQVNGDAYVDSSTGIAAFDSAGAEMQRFGSAQGSFEGLKEAGALAVDHAAGAEVGDVYAVDLATDQIDVFAPAPSGPPAVDGMSTLEVSSQSARLTAEIDADGAPTTYTVQYSTSACTKGPSSCAQHFTCTAGPATCGELPVPPGDAGEGFGDQPVSVSLTGLAPSSTYHYRFLAGNPHGRAVSDTEGAFSTPPAKGRFVADEREWEMVSPPAKSGALIDPLTEAGAVIEAAANGQAMTYVAQAPIGEAEGSRSFEPTQMLSTRSPEGWASQDVATPNERGNGLGQSVPYEYRFFSEDLALALVQPIGTSRLAEPPLSPPLTPREEGDGPGEGQEDTIYLRADSPVEPQQEAETASYEEARRNGGKMGNAGYLALVNDTNVAAGAEFGVPFNKGSAFEFIAGTPDLSHILIQSEIAGKPECEMLVFGCMPGLFEWNAGEPELSYVSTLPNGEPVNEMLGLRGQNVRHAISADGSRIVWSAKTGALYMHDVASGQTIRLDEPQGGSGEGPEDAEFQTASADDSLVFFTDTQRLTPKSGASEGRPDLYVCEVLEDQSTRQLEGCRLTDLSASYETAAHRTEDADVQSLVLGASEDGSYIYFVAGGVLTEAENAEGETATPGGTRCGSATYPQATCNLYVEHYGGEHGNPGWPARPTFIARLSDEDLPDWQYVDNKGFERVQLTSRVSPDGRHLAFMSDRELTGYDNVDTHPQAGGAHDEEVYEYAAPTSTEEEDGEAGTLVCASCDPSGARPDGVYEPPEQTSNPEGVGLLVDRPQTWAGRWLAGSVPGWTRLAASGAEPRALYQSRYLSDSGRLFFDSPADLVPEAENEKEDVYEYEPTGVPQGPHRCTSVSPTFDQSAEGCLGLISSGVSDRESAFLDAGESGGDVFFLTAAPLSPLDTDTSFDVYDAHECTAGSPCIIPPEEKPPPVCESTRECHVYTPAPPASLGVPASAGPGAAGNLTPSYGVLPSKTEVKPKPKPKPKPLTRAQKLAKALQECRAEHRRSKPKRQGCERQARRRYGPIAGAKAKKAGRSEPRGGRAGGAR